MPRQFPPGSRRSEKPVDQRIHACLKNFGGGKSETGTPPAL